LNKTENLSYENNQDRRVTTTTNTGTTFRTWEMLHLQNMDREHENKYQSWQDSQHNENHANSFFSENTRPRQRERGKYIVSSSITPRNDFL